MYYIFLDVYSIVIKFEKEIEEVASNSLLKQNFFVPILATGDLKAVITNQQQINITQKQIQISVYLIICSCQQLFPSTLSI